MIFFTLQYSCMHLFFSISDTAPTLSAVITTRGRPIEGQRYTLICAVSGDELLAPTNRRFQWDKGSNIGVHNMAMYTFDELRPDDAGDYSCTASFDSLSLSGTQTVMGNMTVIVVGLVLNLQVTTHTATTLIITWTVSGSIDRYEVTYNYTVNRCSAPQGAPRTSTIFDGSMKSYTLVDLNEDSNYIITVRAINTAGSTNATLMANTSTSGIYTVTPHII